MRESSLPNRRAEALPGVFARSPALDVASEHRGLHCSRRPAPGQALTLLREQWLSAILLLPQRE